MKSLHLLLNLIKLISANSLISQTKQGIFHLRPEAWEAESQKRNHKAFAAYYGSFHRHFWFINVVWDKSGKTQGKKPDKGNQTEWEWSQSKRAVQQPVMDNGSTKTCELCHLLFLDYIQDLKRTWLLLQFRLRKNPMAHPTWFTPIHSNPLNATPQRFVSFRLIKLCFGSLFLLLQKPIKSAMNHGER